jgi:hypothetical protein
MNIENLEINLNRYDYKFAVRGQKIEVKLDFAQRVFIDLSNPSKVIITDKLTGWNLLTGMIRMSLKGAMIYSFIGMALMAYLCLYGDIVAKLPLTNLFIFMVSWILLWTCYYHIKLENFRQQILLWTQN